MLSPDQENCSPSRTRFWISNEGLRAFSRMVQRFAPNENVEATRAQDELLLALRASDFVSPQEVDDRVQSAARVLAERLEAETYRIARHRQFVLEPQPYRPDVIYGESDVRIRDSQGTTIKTEPSHGFFAQYLAEQRALARGPGAAESGERYSARFT